MKDMMSKCLSGLMAVMLLVLTGLTAACSTMELADRDPEQVDLEHPPSMIEASFRSGGSRLNALAYLANGPGPHPTVLLLHGYPGNEKNLDVAQYLRRGGWNVFFFHYRGAWGSEGEFSFLNAAEDVGAALDHLRAQADRYRVDSDRIVIVGHSMGGRLALAGAMDDAGVDCVVGLAAAPVGALTEMSDDERRRRVEGFRAYADGLIMLAGHDGSNVIEQDRAFADAYPIGRVVEAFSGRKLLMIAAKNDTAVPIEVHEAYAAAFSRPGTVDFTEQVFDADHSFNAHRLRMSRRIADWLDANCR